MPHYTGDLSRSWVIVPLLVMYLLDLGGVGFLGPDEPRYASIGREMTRSGDWITPRLDGEPWFEKPPLLYWMIAAGRRIHLPDEWAARLPVALLSAGFLVFFFRLISREFSSRLALAALAILATSAGWVAFSFAALTDLPMSATLAAAMFIALFDSRPKQGYSAGALLGLSILAKGFVPLVLFAPIFLVARGKRLAMIAGCLVVAAPWYVLCWASNGSIFWNEFFWRHHVERFLTGSLQHVQPVWFYVPVVLLGLFPWTPLVGLLGSRKTYEDVRVRFLAGWLMFAFVFFSAARNKLPGYVLPLLPALAVVLAVGLEKARGAQWWMAASTLLLVALPTIAAALPQALLSGVRKAHAGFGLGAPFLLVAGAVWWLAWRDRHSLAMLTAAMAVLSGVVYMKAKTFPVLDERVSVRAFWRTHGAAKACVENVRRDWKYGLDYYAGHPLPECQIAGTDKRPIITVRNGQLALILR